MQETKQEAGQGLVHEIVSIPTLDVFIEKCLDFNKHHPEIDVKSFKECPVHVYAAQINKPCKTAVAGIRTCPVCGRGMCPVCGNHHVTQISRVTGYIQAVSGFNEAKKQELKDRTRYNIGIGGATAVVDAGAGAIGT